MGIYGSYFNLERLNMLVNKIMKVLSNLFGLNKKISANDIAVKSSENKVKLLSECVIVDSGTNSNGSWIKYGDGTMICTKRIEFSSPFNVSWGVLYETPEIIPIGSFAKSFIDLPMLSITSVIGATVILETPIGFGKDGMAGMFLARPQKVDSDMAGAIDIIAIGRWKE